MENHLSTAGHAGTVLVAIAALGVTAAPPAQAAPARTELTVVVAGCEGCTVQLHQVTDGPHGPRPWSSRSATVSDGRVVLDVPARRTQASSMTLRAPWEGHLGYVTTVVVRYAGQAPGDPVTATQAAAQRRASACWEGTRSRTARLDLSVERVDVPGVRGTVAGTRAWLSPTTVSTGHVRRAPRGVLGSQDLDACRG